MKQVYAVNNSAEAHIISHYLEHNGLKVHIHGEDLSGAIGGIAADNFIKILVPDHQYADAVKHMKEWEAAAPTEEDTHLSQRNTDHSAPINIDSAPENNTNFWMYLIIGIALGWVGNEFSKQIFANASQMPADLEYKLNGNHN